ncbi:MAG: 1,4-dihydroxy-2-naphthoate polyprenyltransferase [Deltaproteobacteria bacterium]|nr:1,4-dihydroxy-2-naphthoate polyprenyltransferase [Deltaproteobacteria bacterium]
MKPATRLQVWLLAIRPATLSAAVAPVLVGSALAWRDGGGHLGAALAALVAAVLIQIGTNLVNDVADCERGADDAARQGPLRVTAGGLLTAGEVKSAAALAFSAATVIGVWLVARSGWPILLLGAGAIAAGVAYTAGPWPLAYHGFGDPFVFAFFGLAAVAGTYYVQSGGSALAVWLAAVPLGALATAILVVNNVRDCDGDRRAGKRTLAVRLGARAGRLEYLALLGLAYAVPPALCAMGAASAWALLPWLSLPWAVRLGWQLATCGSAPGFNAALVNTARLHLAFGVLFALGLLR